MSSIKIHRENLRVDFDKGSFVDISVDEEFVGHGMIGINLYEPNTFSNWFLIRDKRFGGPRLVCFSDSGYRKDWEKLNKGNYEVLFDPTHTTKEGEDE